MTKVLTCEDTLFEISYTSKNGMVLGHIRARTGDALHEARTAQTALFDKLSYIDGASATCGDSELPSSILISGVDKMSGEVDQLYVVGFLPETGFGQVQAPG